MRKRAIAKIIVCSILAVLLTAILLGTIACSSRTVSLPSPLGFGWLKKSVEITEKTIERLPVPNIRFFGCAPVVTINGGLDESDGEQGDYAAGGGTYENAPKSIKIDWAAGRIVVGTHEGSDVQLYEYSGNREIDLSSLPADGGIAESERMRHKMVGDLLKIEMYKTRIQIGFFGIHGTQNLKSKTLVVLLPEAGLDRLELDAAAADVELYDLTVKKLDCDTASGKITAENCAFDEVDFDSAATDATFAACAVDRIDLDVASGSAVFDLVNTPSKIDVDAMSTEIRVILPPDAAFEIKTDALASKVSLNGFSSNLINGRTVVNGGGARFDFDMMTGSVTIEARQDAKNTF